MVWKHLQQQQQRGAQLHARSDRSTGSKPRRTGEAPKDAVEGREAQDHDRADLDVSDGEARSGDYPASEMPNRDGENTPSAPEAGVAWDDVVQPERQGTKGRGSRPAPAGDDLPLPEGK